MSIKTKLFGGITAAVLIATPFIAKHEGLRNWAYLDPISKPTICYGSTVGVRMGDYKTTKQCDELLEKEVLQFMQQVDREILIPVKPNVLAALTSWAYNVGMANVKSSTLLKKLNAGDIAGACRELPRWVYAKGKKLNGLVKRRQEEMELCLR